MGHIMRYIKRPHSDPPVSQRRVPGVRVKPGSTTRTRVLGCWGGAVEEDEEVVVDFDLGDW